MRKRKFLFVNCEKKKSINSFKVSYKSGLKHPKIGLLKKMYISKTVKFKIIQ